MNALHIRVRGVFQGALRVITTAVQGQQTSQMVEIQGAPQPVAIAPGVGSGDDFRTAFAANVASVQGPTANTEATAQPAMTALRSALSSGAANPAANAGALVAKTLLGTGAKSTLAGLAARASVKTNSSDATPDTVALNDTVPNPALSAGPDSLAGKMTTATSSSDDDSGALTNAASSLKPSSPVVDGSVELNAPNTLRRPIVTPDTSGLSFAASGNMSKTATDHKSEATASKPGATSDARQATDQTVVAQALVAAAGLTAAPMVAPATVTVQLDLATLQKADVEEGSPAGGNASSVSSGALAGSHAATGTLNNASVTSLNLDASPAPGHSATSGMVTGEELEAETTQIASLVESGPLASASIVPAAPGTKPIAALPQQTGASAAIPSKNSNVVAGSSLIQSAIGQQSSSTQSKAAAVAVEDVVAKPVAQANAKTAAAPQSTTVAKAQPVTNGPPSSLAAKSNGLAGSNDAAWKAGPVDDGNLQQSGAVFAPGITAAQTPLALQPVDAPREIAVPTPVVSKDAKNKTTESVSTAAPSAASEAGAGSALAPSILSGSDPAASVKDASPTSPAVAAAAIAAPVAHVATEAVASFAAHGSGPIPLAATSSAPTAGAGQAGAVTGAASAHASANAATSALGSDPSLAHQTLLVTPTTLEVGVPNGTQGWLKIRAEVGGQGEVNASLTAGSSGAQEMLHSQLPALNAYLHSEQMPVIATVSDRSFSFAGGHQGTGGQPSGSDSTGGSGSALSQGSASQSDGGQRQTAQPSASIGDPVRGYGTVTGVNELAAVTTSQLGAASAVSAENGQWLNVRV